MPDMIRPVINARGRARQAPGRCPSPRGSLWRESARILVGVAALAGAIARASPRIIGAEFIDEGAPYRSCHASTLAETPSHRLVAAWFAGTAEGNPDVCIYLSREVGSHWTKPVIVADGHDGQGKPLPCWNPVLHQLRRGPLLLFYKVGPSPQGWWGMMRTSHDEGQTWGPARRLPDGILGPIKNKPVERPDGTLVCGSSTESPDGAWRVHIELTSDQGGTWTQTPPLPSVGRYNSIQPTLLTLSGQRLQLLCRTKEMTLTTSISEDGGATWSPLRPAALFSPNSGLDGLTLADGRHWLVYNWRLAPGIEPPGETDGEVRGPATPSWGVRWPLTVSTSRDGEHWEPCLTLEDRPRRDGYAYPAVIQTSDGLVHVAYTWGRLHIKHVTIDPGTP